LKAAEAQRKAAELARPSEPGPFLALARGKAEEGETALARQLYWEFLKKWPRDALVGEAHFELGETYATEQRCQEALSEYGKVIRDYAKSKAAPSAYLKSAACFRTLKLPDDAKLALEELVRAYPKTEAAGKARKELAELERSGRKGSSKKK
jgi:tol-pal system protein YbgF